MKTILAALDLEGEGGAVLARAAQLAGKHGAWLIVLHVIDVEPLSHAAAEAGHSESDLRDHLEHQAIAKIQASLVQIGRTQRTDVRIEFGSPHEVITRVAHKRSADLVVLGQGRSSGKSLRKKVLGSTADRVIRTSPAPALVVKTESQGPYREVVVAVDFSAHSISATLNARKLAPEARLQLVHVVAVPLTFEQALLRAGTPQIEIDRYRSARAATARGDLSAFARDIVGLDNAATRILEGEPGPVLVRLAKGKRVDLLVLGSRGRGVVVQALLGSVAQRVLREADCDVLVASASLSIRELGKFQPRRRQFKDRTGE